MTSNKKDFYFLASKVKSCVVFWTFPIYFLIALTITPSQGACQGQTGVLHSYWGFLGESVLLAQNYVTNALNHPQIKEVEEIQGFNKIIQVLLTKDKFVVVQNVNSREYNYCRRDPRRKTLAFIDKDQRIKICPRAQSYMIEEMAQILIHEAAHIAFSLGPSILDECEATRWELNAVRLGGGTPFKNRYASTCTFKTTGPFRTLRSKGFREPAI